MVGPLELYPIPKAFFRNPLLQEGPTRHGAGSCLGVAEVRPDHPQSQRTSHEFLRLCRVSSGKAWPKDPWEMDGGGAAGTPGTHPESQSCLPHPKVG